MRSPVLVAGAGGGLVGALRAAELGRDVVIVEASEHFRRGNNTSMSTAMIPAAGTRWQRAAGVTDSVDQFLGDITRKTSGQADMRVARTLVEVSNDLVEWLVDSHDIPLSLMTDMRYPGHSADRCHTVPSRHGSELIDYLLRRVAAQPRIEWLRPARLTDVQVSSSGVVGATVTYPNNEDEFIETDSVLLATNGYGANKQLLDRYAPEIANVTYFGSEESRGDALRIGRRLGADAAFLDAYQGYGGVVESSGTPIGWATIMHGAIMVDRTGQRFGDETSGYSEYAPLLASRPGREGWVILDRRIHEMCLPFTDYVRGVDSGVWIWAEDISSIARATGLPEKPLAETIETARHAAQGLKEDPFGREYEAPLSPPFAAVRVIPALFHTQGGLVVNEWAQVVPTGEQNLRGLYASGGAAVGISGHGAAGYLAGNGLLPALGLSFLAAGHMAYGSATGREGHTAG